MGSTSKSQCTSHGWLDSLAVSMSVICAIHCLLTPVLVVLFPILATTFWVHEDFHLWMLFFVLPTTSLAVFLGCRRHRDRFVIALSSLGLICLFAVCVYEILFHFNNTPQHIEVCAHCIEGNANGYLTATTFVNICGGLFLASAHIRNYRLCRISRCSHS